MSHDNDNANYTFPTDSVVYKSMQTQINYVDQFIAPDWELTDIDGQTHKLYEDYLDKGIPVILESFATWCGYCKGYHTEHYLSDIATNYDDVAVFMVETASGGTLDDLSTNFTKNGITTNWVDNNASTIIVLDDSEADAFRVDHIMNGAAGNYGATGYPAVFMIATDGTAMKISSQHRTDFDDFNDMHDEVIAYEQHHAELLDQLGVTISEDENVDEDDPPTANNTDNNLTVFKSLVAAGTQKAPAFQLTDLDGNEVDLYADFLDQGKPVVLYMFATWCGYSKQYTEKGLLTDLANDHGDDVQVILLEASSSSNLSDLNSFIDSYGLDNQLVIDSTSMNSAYGLTGFPTLIAIGSSGDMINWGSVRNSFSNAQQLHDEMMEFEAYTSGNSVNDAAEVAVDDGNNDGEEPDTQDNTPPAIDDDFSFDSNSVVYKSMDVQLDYTENFKAPNWELTDIDGNTHNLYDDYLNKGIPVIMESFATWCGYCKGYHTEHYLGDIAANYDDVAVFMIETASGGTIDDLSTNFTKNGITTNWVDNNASSIIVLDDSQADSFRSDYIMTGAAGNYGATGYPAVFMINTDGYAMKIASQFRTGFDDFNDMHDEVIDFDQHYAALMNQFGATIPADIAGSGGNVDDTPEDDTGVWTVYAQGMRFADENLDANPDSSVLTINVGDTVEWINKGGYHNVVLHQGGTHGDEDAMETMIKQYDLTESSGQLIVIGEYTFNEPGLYEYHCNPHESMGMKASIEVLAPPAEAEAVINNMTLFKSLVDAGTQQAPEFILTDLDGNEVDLYADFLDQGKPVVLELFATWCGYCKAFAESNILADLATDYGDEVQVIMVESSGSSTRADLDSFLANPDYNLQDEIIIESTEINSAYGLQYFPTLFAIGTSGDMINWGSVRNSFSDAAQLFDEVMAFEAFTSGEVAEVNPDDVVVEEPEVERSTDGLNQFKAVVDQGTEIAPAFILTDLNGDEVNLYEDYLDQGKTVVLELFATWCSYCKAYAETGILTDLQDDYDDIQVILVEAASNSTAADLDNYINTYSIQDELIIESTALNADYNLQYFPTLYAISPNGEMINFGSVRFSFDDHHDMHDELIAYQAYSLGTSNTEDEGIMGDINNDGTLNIIDVVQTISLILSSDATDTQRDSADINQDGTLNIIDVVMLMNEILNVEDDGGL